MSLGEADSNELIKHSAYKPVSQLESQGRDLRTYVSTVTAYSLLSVRQVITERDEGLLEKMLEQLNFFWLLDVLVHSSVEACRWPQSMYWNEVLQWILSEFACLLHMRFKASELLNGYETEKKFNSDAFLDLHKTIDERNAFLYIFSSKACTRIEWVSVRLFIWQHV